MYSSIVATSPLNLTSRSRIRYWGVAGVTIGRQFMKHTPAQFLVPDRQASALRVVKTQPLASQLFAQYAVLLLKILDDSLLLLVEPASEGNQNQAKRVEG